jgi:hypothetical protein
MAIYDARQGLQSARPIRHFAYRDDGKTPNVNLRPLLAQPEGEFDDPYIPLLQGDRWRAIMTPIDANKDGSLSGLYLVMQQREKLIAGPGRKLHANLWWFTILTIVLGVAYLVVVPVVFFARMHQ